MNTCDICEKQIESDFVGCVCGVACCERCMTMEGGHAEDCWRFQIALLKERVGRIESLLLGAP